MRFAAHPIRQHKQVQRGHNAKAVLVVGAHATYIGHAAAHDLHEQSPALAEHTRPARNAGNPVPTLTDTPASRKAMNPTNYSLFRHIRPGYGRVWATVHRSVRRGMGSFRLQSHHALAVFRVFIHDVVCSVAYLSSPAFAATAPACLRGSHSAPAEAH